MAELFCLFGTEYRGVQESQQDIRDGKAVKGRLDQAISHPLYGGVVFSQYSLLSLPAFQGRPKCLYLVVTVSLCFSMLSSHHA